MWAIWSTVSICSTASDTARMSSLARGATTTPPITVPLRGRANSLTKPSRKPCILARAFVASASLTDAASTWPESTEAWVTPTVAISGQVEATSVKLALSTNARAKMQGFRDGFVKLFARPRSGTVVGGVVVAPRASELILAVSLAVEQMLTVDQMAHTFAVYPSLSGSLTEAARKLMRPAEDTR